MANEPNVCVGLSCAEHNNKCCEDLLKVPVPFTDATVFKTAVQAGWFLSVITAPGQGESVPLINVLICPTCAKRVYSAELIEAARAELLKSYGQ
jgi:hypothetical protein